MTAESQSHTLVDAMVEALRRAGRSGGDGTPPAALLWTDPDGQWRPVVELLRGSLPAVYILGDDYDAKARIGPVIWLKCVVDRTVPEGPPEGEIPVLYLPGVARQQLRMAEDCPTVLQPLVELLYRGSTFHQSNGRDWTVEAFLSSPDALGLDVAQDQATRQALVRSLAMLARADIRQLRKGRLEAEDFDGLAVNDPVRGLLRWMSDPIGERQRMSSAMWEALKGLCRKQFAFDPEADGEGEAGVRLGKGQGGWAEVWNRYCEAPGLYPGVPGLLRRARPGQLSLETRAETRSRWPDENERAEARLREDLGAVGQIPRHEACDRLERLETQHAERRGWVWAKLGQSPLAIALGQLAVVGTHARAALAAPNAEAFAGIYAESAWKADAAALEALAGAASDADRELVGSVLRSVYGPWLDESARNFQKVLGDKPPRSPRIQGEKGVCLLFADGLRLDVARRLSERLTAKGLRVRDSHRWTALPSVTATAKPAVTPVTDKLGGATLNPDFEAIVIESGQPATAPRLRVLMATAGVAVLDAGATEGAADSGGGGWTEAGDIDHMGHLSSRSLPHHVRGEIERLSERVEQLLSAGWTKVRVVTDHGWLYLPKGLPKVDLPVHLTESRWKRCATIKGSSMHEALTAPWHWNAAATFATAPGIACFSAGIEYAHGGLSPQECVVPDLVVEAPGGRVGAAKIESVRWQGLRCKVVVSGSGALKVDLRQKPAVAASSIVAPKDVGPDGATSVVVADDDHQGIAAVIVVLGADGNILDRKPTTVGEAS